jgi:hypothetical protein
MEGCDRLLLPCEDAAEWKRIEDILHRPVVVLADLDAMINAFSVTGQACRFFATIEKHEEAKKFDFVSFLEKGVPLMVAVALEMPALFANQTVKLLLGQNCLEQVTLSRRQCACLLAHSFFGSITASARQVKKEKWAFRAAQLFFLE